MENQPILTAEGICKRFGGVTALDQAKFECRRGQVHALIGENGAGKSTLVKILCGVVHPDSGKIRLNGKEVTINTPTEATSLGIAAVFQELSLVPELSVAENIYLGCEPTGFLGQIDFKKMRKDAAAIMNRLGFDIDVETLVKDMNFSQQQLVEIAKALSKEPDVIIMDEATSALGSKDTAMLFGLIRKLVKEENKAVIFISHKMDELAQISDVATVYRDAHFVSTFTWGERTNEEIINMVAGRAISGTFPPKPEKISDEVALSVKGVTYLDKLKDVSFEVHKGEIFGLGGLTGHGQNEVLDVIFGAVRPDKGEIKVSGRPVVMKSPRDAIKNGVALTPADRKGNGLLLKRSIRDNLTLMTLNKRSRFGIIDSQKEDEAILTTSEMLQIKTSSSEQFAENLSGGNQQKVVIGKALLTNSDVLLLSDPTRGIDIGTKHEIYPLIRRLADQGMSVVLYSTENTELLGLCDRVGVLKQGEMVATLEGADLTEKNILRAALGFANEEEING